MKKTTTSKVRITQIRSTINMPKRQRLTIQALGLGKLHCSVEVACNPQILGMIHKVDHLLKVTQL